MQTTCRYGPLASTSGARLRDADGDGVPDTEAGEGVAEGLGDGSGVTEAVLVGLAVSDSDAST